MATNKVTLRRLNYDGMLIFVGALAQARQWRRTQLSLCSPFTRIANLGLFASGVVTFALGAGACQPGLGFCRIASAEFFQELFFRFAGVFHFSPAACEFNFLRSSLG